MTHGEIAADVYSDYAERCVGFRDLAQVSEFVRVSVEYLAEVAVRESGLFGSSACDERARLVAEARPAAAEVVAELAHSAGLLSAHELMRAKSS